MLEVASITRGKHLGHRARVKLMLEASNGQVGSLLGVVGKLVVDRESAEAHLGTPLGNDTFP